ncbi:amidohydrolase family protein [Roseomonas sp. CCTCC AB2023176]|uniref:amidohydrolase family protein n=1 Tax=Roseomonas sp. CCTCC AB2023176 TaxID=3342640 RepID=UPI0035E0139C
MDADSRLVAPLVDCHHHVYDVRLPAVPGTRASMDAPLPAFRAMAQRVGITHHVLVQPSTYGFDNALHLAARAERPGRSVVVAVIPPDTAAAECRDLAARGVVGLRANLVHSPGADVAALGRLCADQGWHLQVFATADAIAGLAPVLRALPCPLVLDHYAGLPVRGFAQHAAWEVVADMLDAGRAWIKLSSPYALPGWHDGGWGDLVPLTQALAEVGESNLVWGTNWPHPNTDAPQDEATLLRGILAPLTTGQAEAVRWNNPARLYGFAA